MDGSCQCYDEAIGLARELQLKPRLRECLKKKADILEKKGDGEGSLILMDEARALEEEIKKES